MKINTRTILRILFKEDLISYLVGVPLAVYIVVFCGNFKGEQIEALLIGVAVAAVLVSPVRFAVNLRRMLSILKKLEDPSSGIEDLSSLKAELFREPVKHAWSIAIAWFAATSIAFFVAHLLNGITAFHLFVLLLVWSVTMPSGFVITYFITEKGLVTILSDHRLETADKNNIKTFSITRKALMSLSILAWYPTAVLSFIIYEIYHGIIVFDNIGIHIAFIVFMMTCIMFAISYLLISSLRLTLKSSGDGLRELAIGNLTIKIPRISCDEISLITCDINVLAESLKKMVISSVIVVNEINSDSRKLLDYMEDISEGSMSVASSMEEMSSAIEELGGSSDTIADNSIKHREFVTKVKEHVGTLLDTIEQFAGKAADAFEVSNGAMQRVERGSGALLETQRYVHDISESTRTISESVDVIKDIADQVNLLSLNASIEAARAGEHGRGFSVVAEEISKLADTTQRNADGIIKTINQIISNVEKELKAMEMLTKAFSEIQQYIEETAGFMHGISSDVSLQKNISGEVKGLFEELLTMSAENLTGSREQSKAHQEIVNNVSNVADLMTLTAEKTAAVRDMSKELASRGANLLESIKIFRME